MSKDLKKLGETIRKYRKKYNYSSATIASAAGVAQSYISDLENGKKVNPRMDVLKKIANKIADNPYEWLRLERELLTLAGYSDVLDENSEKKIENFEDLINEQINNLESEVSDNEIKINIGKSKNSISVIRFKYQDEIVPYDLFTYLSNEYTQTTKENGMLITGPVPLYYKGKKLSEEDKEKVINMLDILF